MSDQIDPRDTQTVTWIPVSERLPEEGFVLDYHIAFHGGAVGHSTRLDGAWRPVGDYSYPYPDEVVTHWAQPLKHPSECEPDPRDAEIARLRARIEELEQSNADNYCKMQASVDEARDLKEELKELDQAGYPDTELNKALREAVNRFGADASTGIPDFILADVLEHAIRLAGGTRRALRQHMRRAPAVRREGMHGGAE